MAITVGELVRIPDLRTQVFAGEAGLDHRVSWAHVSELPDPTEYLAAGELLMTVGYTIPEGSEAQETYVERLAEARLSGLLVAEKMYAPELTPEMAAVANRLSFPILLTAYDVPFTAISRAVAEANRSAEHARLLRAVSVYDTARLTVGGASGSETMTRLGELVGCDLYVVDPDRGRSLIRNGRRVPEEIAEALVKEMSSRSQPMPALLRLRSGRGSVIALFVPASRPAALVAVTRTEEPPDATVLRHVATVAALEVEKLTADYERKRRLGAEVLAGLVDERIGAESASHLLSEWNLADEPRLLASCSDNGGAEEHSSLHLRLEDDGVPHILLRRAPILTALLPAKPDCIQALREEINETSRVGLSDPLGGTSRVPEAYREAQWALQSAEADDEPLVYYESASLSPFLPHGLGESRRVVEHVLGPVLSYDANHGSRLVTSLRSFLSHNRSWQKAAASLHVHKQTLVYRMRRVEELTGRHLDQTEDVAEFWLALKAAEALGQLGPDTSSA